MSWWARVVYILSCFKQSYSQEFVVKITKSYSRETILSQALKTLLFSSESYRLILVVVSPDVQKNFRAPPIEVEITRDEIEFY